MNTEDTTIIVKKTTRDKLKKLGAKGEAYDAIISRLLPKQRKEAA